MQKQPIQLEQCCAKVFVGVSFFLSFTVCHVFIVPSCRPPLGTEVADHTPHAVLWRDLDSAAAPKRPQRTGACWQNGDELKWKRTESLCL